ncbi:hypothetical protein [Bradyrhizobium sp. B120]
MIPFVGPHTDVMAPTWVLTSRSWPDLWILIPCIRGRRSTRS